MFYFVTVGRSPEVNFIGIIQNIAFKITYWSLQGPVSSSDVFLDPFQRFGELIWHLDSRYNSGDLGTWLQVCAMGLLPDT